MQAVKKAACSYEQAAFLVRPMYSKRIAFRAEAIRPDRFPMIAASKMHFSFSSYNRLLFHG